MSVNRSNHGYIGLVKQSAQGTPGTVDFFLKYLSESLNSEINGTNISEGGDGRNRNLAIRESISPTGEIELYARPQVSARLFSYCLGFDTVKGTAKATGGSGALASQAASGQKALVMTLASTLAPMVVGDIIQIGADYATGTEIDTIASMAGNAKAGGGSSTVGSEAAAGQKVVNVADATNFVGNDYITIGAAAAIEVHQIDSVLVNAITLKTDLNFTHAIGVAVVEIDAWTITCTNNLSATHASATAVTEVQAPYFHKSVPVSTTSLPWLTIERDIATLTTETFADCKVGTIKISLEAGQPVKLTAGILGISSTEQSSQQTPTYETTVPFIFQGGSYYRDGDQLNGAIDNSVQTIAVDDGDNFLAADVIRIDDEEILIGGISTNNLTTCTRGYNSTTAASHLDNAPIYLKVSNIKAAEITIDNKLQDDIFTTAITRYDILEGQIEIPISFTQYFERGIDHNRLIYGESGTTYSSEPYEGSFKFVCTRASNDGIAYTLDVEIPRISYEAAETHLDPETKALELECSGQALYTSSTLPMIITKTSTSDPASYLI